MSDSNRTRPSGDFNDDAFLDFLRTAGRTLLHQRTPPPDRTDSADRKRRHTGSGPEPERRAYPYPTYSGRPSDTHGIARSGSSSGSSSGSAQAGNSTDTAIDLTASFPQAPPPPRTHLTKPSGSNGSMNAGPSARSGRRESDMVLPRWQPDHEVSKCPVCETEFGFLNRRHHCRKCGRVVCAKCSPHRITIPRQYIVQAPNPYYDDDASPGSPSNSRGNPALGGGEVVRVCNPCVPDPWTPNQNPNATAAPQPNNAPHSGALSLDPQVNFIRSQMPTDRSRPDRYHVRGSIADYPMNVPPRQRSSSDRRPSHFISDSELGLPRYMTETNEQPATNHRAYMGPPQGSLSLVPGNTSNDTLTDAATLEMLYRHARRPGPARPAAPPPSSPPRPRRRQVREEDECPVCGREMPPGETAREEHIQSCIASRFFTSTGTPPPATSTTGDGQAPEGSRPRATSFRPRGMAKTVAEEKHCIGPDGEPKECIICLEEFQPGDELGTLECWCTFHRECIRNWWATKGAGSCPTHRLYDGE